jgi:AcrR family transcriptional regulator
MNTGSRGSSALGGRALALKTTSSNATQSTSERLLATAAHLFRTKGYAATTTREIASKLGLQKGSLYYHIEGKEDLLYRLCVDSLSRLHGAAQKAVDQEEGAPAKINALMLSHVTGMLADRDMHATMLIELRSLTGARRADVIRLRDQYEELIMGVISEGQREGTIRSDVDFKYLCLAMLNIMNWTIFWFDPIRELTAGSLAEILATVYLQGIMRDKEK